MKTTSLIPLLALIAGLASAAPASSSVSISAHHLGTASLAHKPTSKSSSHAPTPTWKSTSRSQAHTSQPASKSTSSHSTTKSASRSASKSASRSTAPSSKPSGSAAFRVNSTLPGIPFPIPESYAGYLSINSQNPQDDRQLYFWYTPVDAGGSDDDIIFWFNGGPGCSSMEGLWQENGPVLLPYYADGESVKPVLNPYSNHKAAHAVWVDQPGNTGFSQAGEDDTVGLKAVADDFVGFLINFLKTFPNLQGKRLWLQGESFAGAYIPYMANRIYSDPTLKAKGVNLKGVQINDPSWANDNFMENLPIIAFAVKNQQLLGLSDSQIAGLTKKASKYGLDTYYAKNLVYPPKGLLQVPKGWSPDVYDVYDDVLNAWNGAHCSNVYDISVQCPYLNDPLGFPLQAQNPSADNFFNNQTGFLSAIHVKPGVTFLECKSEFKSANDPAPEASIMPSVIEHSEHVVIGGGDHDILLLTMGSELAIQNMTWSGQQGFQSGAKTSFSTSQGVRGQYHTERGLSMIEFYYAGHMIPQDDGEAALRATKYLIGTLETL